MLPKIGFSYFPKSEKITPFSKDEDLLCSIDQEGPR